MLKTFEVDEPVVEATNDVSIEMAAERSVDVDTMLRTGERRTEDLVELERIQEIAAASDGRIQVISVDLPLRGAPASSYQPLSAAELDCVGLPRRYVARTRRLKGRMKWQTNFTGCDIRHGLEGVLRR